MTKKEKEFQEGIFWAAISYFWVLFLVTIIVARDNEFALYHAKQGLVLFVCSLALAFVSMIPLFGWIIGIVGGIAILILFIMGLINALTGKMVPLPYIGKFGENIKI